VFCFFMWYFKVGTVPTLKITKEMGILEGREPSPTIFF